jgi:hypothetical protein
MELTFAIALGRFGFRRKKSDADESAGKSEGLGGGSGEERIPSV